MARIGGRGCPNCGSHATEGLSRAGAYLCSTCGHRWVPHEPNCRGWNLDLWDPQGPTVRGCSGCGVSDQVARTWPEAWRDLARHLDGKKMEATVTPAAAYSAGVKVPRAAGQ